MLHLGHVIHYIRFLVFQLIFAFSIIFFSFLIILDGLSSIKSHVPYQESLHLVTCIISSSNRYHALVRRFSSFYGCILLLIIWCFWIICWWHGSWLSVGRRYLTVGRILWFLALWVITNMLFGCSYFRLSSVWMIFLLSVESGILLASVVTRSISFVGHVCIFKE